MIKIDIWLAQEFFIAGWMKLSYGRHAPEWFAGLSFPLPLNFLSADLNWLAAGIGEALLSALLLLGFQARFASLGLLFITWVAVCTVHSDLGLAGWNQIDTEMGQGFKLPLMMVCMLLTILTQGGGRWSADRVLCRYFASATARSV